MHQTLTLRRCALNACLVMLALAPIWTSSPAQTENTVALEQLDAQHEVSGTLAKLDVAAGRGILMTDLQKPIFFRLDRPELFERLSIGDRVTMQLDDEGRVLKVIETLPAEVHEPPPPAK